MRTSRTDLPSDEDAADRQSGDSAGVSARDRSPRERHLSRRALLGGAAGLAAVGATAAVVSGARGGDPDAVPASAPYDGLVAAPPPRPFHGTTQTGVATPAREQSLLAAFRLVATDAVGLEASLKALTSAAHELVDALPGPGGVARDEDPGLPPTTTGLLDPGEDVEVTVAVGSSLFDDRFGLADRRPRELTRMGFLANDRLVPAWTHGDLLVTLSADRPDAVLHGLRQLMRATRASLVLQWVVDGYSRSDPHGTAGRTRHRNLLGFKDGSANPDVRDAAAMGSVVWDDTGGTYEVVRLIRLLVERWDRVSLREQEAIIGRAKTTGAPLGLAREEDDPAYGSDPRGERIPLDAHIRLAQPRTGATAAQLMLRKGFSFQRGFDGAGQLDQGLAFVSYQRELATFLAVQERLAGERLEEYTLPFGGGFFYVLPGVRDDRDWYGRTLLT